MTIVTDDELMAFAEGVLPEERCEEIAALLESDATLDARLAALMDNMGNDDNIRAAFAEVLKLPVPKPLLDSITPPATSSNVVSFAEAQRTKVGARAFWATGLSMAASLALGLWVGGQFLSDADGAGDETLIVASADGPIASKRLAQVLTDLPGGEVVALGGAGRARMSITFRDGAGRLCRQFSVEGQSAATDGAACFQDSEWRIEAVGARGIEGGDVRTASGDAADAVLATVDALIVGDPLDAAAEAKALKAAKQ